MMSRFRIRPVAGQPVFYGWYIVAVAFFANFVSIGSAFYAMNAFMEPLCQTHGWSRTDVNLAMVWGTLFGYPGQFVWGSLVNRFPIRHLMLGGAVSAGAVFMLFTHASVLWQFYVLYVLLYLANGAYGGIVSNTVVSNWFRKKRGGRWGLHRRAYLFPAYCFP
jgi:OFA family oxalate/formate antiporter-like MFS transporter